MEDQKKSPFQTIMMVVFAAGILIAVALFATNKSGGPANEVLSGTVTVWGTLEKELFMFSTATAISLYPDIKIDYREFTEDEFETVFVNAMASGTGPDVILVTDETIVRQKARTIPIQYENFPRSDFQNMYVDAANVFLMPEGVVAFPLFLDPLVMYYNKDKLASEFLLEPPRTWREVVDLVPRFTQRTDAGSILKSAFALGTYQNIPHAQEILSLLIMQLGNPIVVQSPTGFQVTLKEQGIRGEQLPAANSLDFYTSFADKSKVHYSWNASLSDARDAFLAEDLAFYMGYASEYNDILERNPNLNFDVALIPQVSADSTKTTFGRVHGLAVTRNTQNPTAAFSIVNALTDPQSAQEMSNTFRIPPIRRTLLAVAAGDPVLETFYNSAIVARTWFNPDPDAAANIFEGLIVDRNAGRDDSNALVAVAHDLLQDLFFDVQPVN